MSDKLEKKTVGAWLIHHTNKLQQVDNTGSFDRIVLAGKAGLLLSSLAASTDERLINKEKVNAIAIAARINTSLELPTLLAHLEQERLISRSKSGEVSVIGVTTASVLGHTADIFQAADPNPQENAVIDVAELASISPIQNVRATEFISDTYKLTTASAQDLLVLSEDIGFIDAEPIDDKTKLFFNGNLFRRDNAKKTLAIINSLGPSELQHMQDLEELFQSKSCVAYDEAKHVMPDDLLRRLQSIGMFDLNSVINEIESVEYLTKPAAFGKYGNPLVDDALNLAKAFVTSLYYGMYRSYQQRGRINALGALMRKLIRGEWVGPATAIGQDYRILELKSVIEVRSETNGMFSMRLLKKDVGELAFQALVEGDVSENSLPLLKGVNITNYSAPEANRELVRKNQTVQNKRQVSEILRILRTGTSL